MLSELLYAGLLLTLFDLFSSIGTWPMYMPGIPALYLTLDEFPGCVAFFREVIPPNSPVLACYGRPI